MSAAQELNSIQSIYGQALSLEQQGDEDFVQRNYAEALEHYNQSLAEMQHDSSPINQARLLKKRGETYRKLGDTALAIEDYEAALSLLSNSLANSLDSQTIRGEVLNGLGLVHHQLGQYDQAQTYLEQSLLIREQIGDRLGRGYTLNNLGLLAQDQADYAIALEYHHQAAAIFADLGQVLYEEIALSNLGSVQTELGQYATALETLNRAFRLSQATEDRYGQGIILHNIGLVHGLQKNYQQALYYYRRALLIRQDLGDRLGEQRTLNNLGEIYTQLGEHTRALATLEEALALAREYVNLEDEAQILNSLGLVYQNLAQYDLAWFTLNQALSLRHAIGDRKGQRITLSRMGQLLASQSESELAILFYKQAVNLSEGIRQDLRELSRAEQEIYAVTVAETYRQLADLLLQHDRVLEAQQVLDLLKVQELENYLQDVRGEQTLPGVTYGQLEQQLLDLYSRALSEGVELAQMRTRPYETLTPDQQQRIGDWTSLESEILNHFFEFIDSPEVVAVIDQLDRIAQRQNLDLAQLNSLQNNLRDLQQNAVLLYPLVLEDRLELVLLTPYAPPIHRPVAVDRISLNRAIAAFRQSLQDPNSDVLPHAQQLYRWLIEPIAADLAAVSAETIVYAPDSQLRYIPLAALHDGDQWLAQRFRVNHITAASLTDFDKSPQFEPRLLAAAFADTSLQMPVTVGNQTFSFTGLPYAGVEVENLAAILPDTAQLMNRDFSRESMRQRLGNYTIIHLATHAQFVLNNPDESFILFGNGDILTLRELRTLNLPNAELVVLSACETGLGGLGNGEEILGFGYQVQRTGARAAIASLWQVSDGGTQALMDAFYAALNNGYNKAESLQRAQQALITGDYEVLGLDERGAVGIRQRIDTTVPAEVAQQLDHPYYWAPFILIGNGL